LESKQLFFTEGKHILTLNLISRPDYLTESSSLIWFSHEV